jgi:hypothetical protein
LSESRGAKAPISSHPAFPAIVALWFAALLGLGSLVLPVALIERLVAVTHISSIISSAQPPLGFTARAGIALAASIAGACIGLWLARKVAASSVPEAPARGFSLGSERPCRPISAPDELGEEKLDSPNATAPPLVQKRRSLAMEEDNGPSSYLQAVPLPGQPLHGPAEPPQLEDLALPEPAGADEPVKEADDEPLELGAFTAHQDSDFSLESDDDEDDLEALRMQIHTLDAPTVEPPSFAKPKPSQDDPLPFAAPSLRRSAAAAFDEEEQADVTEDDNAYQPFDGTFADDEPFAEEAAPQLTIVEAGGEVGGDDRPVEELGLVQLAARLGASLERRRAWLAARQPDDPVPAPVPTPFVDEVFEAARPEDAARAIADFFGPANADQAEEGVPAFQAVAPQVDPEETSGQSFQPLPAPLRGVPIDQEEDIDEEALGASLSLPLDGSYAQAQDTAANEVENFDEEDSEEGEYSSLLAMKNPFARQQEFVRVDDPEDDSGSIEPAVTFPSASTAVPEVDDEEPIRASAARPFDPPKYPVDPALRPATAAAPRDPGDAERSLRDALTTLQRMSGAA